MGLVPLLSGLLPTIVSGARPAAPSACVAEERTLWAKQAEG